MPRSSAKRQFWPLPVEGVALAGLSLRHELGEGVSLRNWVVPPCRDEVHEHDPHYASLGFTTRAYEGGGYGFATCDGVEIHLGISSPTATPAAAYLFVDDAHELAAIWRVAGAVVHPPVDTDWGQHEGALVDPDGNVIRFGSATTPTST